MSPNPDPNQTPTPVLRSSVGLSVKRTSTRSSSRIAYSAAGQRRSSTNQNRVGKTYRETDKMQAGMRPRQRTFTSCTECRRRKQRCNQAKDRPCNNCARRYPPVAFRPQASTGSWISTTTTARGERACPVRVRGRLTCRHHPQRT
ncbi:hypothetical protein BGZ57DRAFT_170254 [Hyaloscypha finlandica]|nr:hypothetical protein BGZ57DRAFT_170254 [Hyaloscypha finlandica]